ANELIIIDISDAAGMTETGRFQSSYYPYSVHVSGNYAYLAEEWGGIEIVNISNPANPTLTKSLSSIYAEKVFVAGNYLYAACSDEGFRIYDISNPQAPVLQSLYNDFDDNWIESVFISGNYAYIPSGREVKVLNIYDKTKPAEVGSYRLNIPVNIVAVDEYIFVADALKGLVVLQFDDFVSEVVEEDKIIPETFSLKQNYPNPFNPSTTITYDLPKPEKVLLKIYDILGREIRTIVNSEKPAGSHAVIWNGRDNYGMQVASGMYIYRIIAGEFSAVRKMVFVK
ncbi:T9SS type A sorting domain-containing protein, partial [candidate division KSB1 bacterium]